MGQALFWASTVLPLSRVKTKIHSDYMWLWCHWCNWVQRVRWGRKGIGWLKGDMESTLRPNNASSQSVVSEQLEFNWRLEDAVSKCPLRTYLSAIHPWLSKSCKNTKQDSELGPYSVSVPNQIAKTVHLFKYKSRVDGACALLIVWLKLSRRRVVRACTAAEPEQASGPFDGPFKWVLEMSRQ